MYYEKKIIASGACTSKTNTVFYASTCSSEEHKSAYDTFEDDQIFMQCFSHNDKTVEIYIILF